jgi:hypothetical protein
VAKLWPYCGHTVAILWPYCVRFSGNCTFEEYFFSQKKKNIATHLNFF